MRTIPAALLGFILLVAAADGCNAAPAVPEPSAGTARGTASTAPSEQPPPTVSSTGSAAAAVPAARATPVTTSPTAHVDELLITRDHTLAVRDLKTGKERTVLTTPGNQFVSFPAWSPDGNRFLFVLETAYPADAPPQGDGTPDWGSDLYLAGADGANARPLIRHDAPGVQIASPSWSPDGGTIIYTYFGLTHDAQGNVQGVINQARRLDLATGASSLLVDNAAGAEFCPDGKTSVYVRFDQEASTRAEIMRADGAGRNGVVIVTPMAAAQSFLYPRFSRDCRQIVFAAVNGTSSHKQSGGPAAPLLRLLDLLPPVAEAHNSMWELWSVDADGTHLRRLTHLAEDEPYPAWSADGRSIVFLATGGLYQMADDGSGLRMLGPGTSHGQVSWRQ